MAGFKVTPSVWEMRETLQTESLLLEDLRKQVLAEPVDKGFEDISDLEDDREFEIESLHGLIVNKGDLLSSTAEATWISEGKRSFTMQSLSDCLGTKKQKTMVLSHLKKVSTDAKMSLGPVFSLTHSLFLSGVVLLGKTIRNRMSSNPRSTGARAVGLLTCPAIPMCEEQWKVVVHLKCPARCHVWKTTGPHKTAIPAFREPIKKGGNLGPSRLAYVFETTLALTLVLPWSEVHAEVRSPQPDANVMACLPKGYLARAVPSNRLIGMSLDIEAGIGVYHEGVDWDKVANWAEQGLQASSWAIVIAKRYFPRTSLTHDACL